MENVRLKRFISFFLVLVMLTLLQSPIAFADNEANINANHIETFEKEISYSTKWVRSHMYSYTGDWSLKSQGTSDFTFKTTVTEESELCFKYLIKGESDGYESRISDHFQVYVDGVQILYTDRHFFYYSASPNWESISYNISPGEHVIKFDYIEVSDGWWYGSTFTNHGSVFVDNIGIISKNSSGNFQAPKFERTKRSAEDFESDSMLFNFKGDWKRSQEEACKSKWSYKGTNSKLRLDTYFLDDTYIKFDYLITGTDDNWKSITLSVDGAHYADYSSVDSKNKQWKSYTQKIQKGKHVLELFLNESKTGHALYIDNLEFGGEVLKVSYPYEADKLKLELDENGQLLEVVGCNTIISKNHNINAKAVYGKENESSMATINLKDAIYNIPIGKSTVKKLQSNKEDFESETPVLKPYINEWNRTKSYNSDRSSSLIYKNTEYNYGEKYSQAYAIYCCEDTLMKLKYMVPDFLEESALEKNEWENYPNKILKGFNSVSFQNYFYDGDESGKLFSISINNEDYFSSNSKYFYLDRNEGISLIDDIELASTLYEVNFPKEARNIHVRVGEGEWKIVSYSSILNTCNVEYDSTFSLANLSTIPVIFCVGKEEVCIKTEDMAGNVSEEIVLIPEAGTIESPKNLKVTDCDDTWVEISWESGNKDNGSGMYVVFRDGKNIGKINRTSFKDEGLQPLTKYKYQIFAEDISGRYSKPSSELEATTLKDIKVPTAPTNFQISYWAYGTYLFWNPSADNIGVKEYWIYKDGEKFDVVAHCEGAQISKNFENLPQGNYYAVAVDNCRNVSDKSNIAFCDREAPEPSENLKIKGLGAYSVTFTWDESKDNVKTRYYIVYVNGAYRCTVSNTEYTDNFVTKGDTYRYTLIAVDEAGNKSQPSEELVVTVTDDKEAPSKPEGLKIKDLGASSATFTWDESKDNVKTENYIVYVNGVYRCTVSNTEYTDKYVISGETYRYSLIAVDAAGNKSQPSDELVVAVTDDKEAPTKPEGLKIKSKTGSSVTLTWLSAKDNVGVTSYEIYMDGKSIEKTHKLEYKKTSLEAGKPYRFAIKALDAAGNTSEESDYVSAIPLKPNILQIKPVYGDYIGGKNQKLNVSVTNSGNINGASAVFEYKDKDEWKKIDTPVNGPIKIDENMYVFACEWDVTSIPEENISVRYRIVDADGNMDEKSLNYTIDKKAPEIPKNVTVVSKDMKNIIKWEDSKDGDVKNYKVSRALKENGEFIEIAMVDVKSGCIYTDNNVKPGEIYYYRLSSIDIFGNESELSSIAEAVVVNDEEKPEVIGIEPIDGSTVGKKAQITIRSRDNTSLQSLKFQYQVKNGSWTDIETVSVSGSSNTYILDWDTKKLSGNVKFHAIAIDQAGNTSDGLPERNYYIDKQGPHKVTDLKAEVNTSNALLRWSYEPGEDFDYFKVEKLKDGGIFEDVGIVNDKLGIQISGLKTNKEYKFKVVAYDKYGNRGEESEILTVVTNKDNTKPVITAIMPESGYFSKSIPLTASAWDDTKVARIGFEVSKDLNKWEEIPDSKQSTASSTTYNYDISALSEGTYYIRAVAWDSSANMSETDKEFPYIEYRVDHTKPQSPEGFKLKSSSGNIYIVWDKGEEEDLSYYKVYRSKSESGEYILLGDRLNTLGYRDYNTSLGEKFYYKVSAVDFAGNESDLSKSVVGMLANDTEKPVIISISKNDGSTLGANPVISVLASDNYRLSKVKGEYKNEKGEWVEFCSKELTSYSGVVELYWDTKSLSDGEYEVRFIAIDFAGNESDPYEVLYNFKLQGPPIPEVTLTPGGYKLSLMWNKVEGAIYYYILRAEDIDGNYEFKDVVEGTFYEDTDVLPGKSYSYIIEPVDFNGNKSKSKVVEGVPLNEDKIPPVAKAGPDQVITKDIELEFDGTKSTDNDRIVSYSWDLGDGTKSNGPKVFHGYQNTGEYLVTLTVEDASGNKASDTLKVKVIEKSNAGTINVNVVDADTGLPVKGAYVHVNLSEGMSNHFVSDAKGNAVITAPSGIYSVSAYIEKYLPDSRFVDVRPQETTDVLLRIKKGEVLVGDLKVKRMELDEVAAYGIDVTAPTNQNIFRFEVKLGFEKMKKNFSFCVNDEGKFFPSGDNAKTINWGGTSANGGGLGSSIFFFGGSKSGNGKDDEDEIVYVEAIPSEHPEVPPTLVFLTFDKTVSWTKEFFKVGLSLQNMAGQQFPIKESRAVISIPVGLSLAETEEGQSRTKLIEEIGGGQSKEVEWILRGDKEGEYDIEVDYKGKLMPFNALLQKKFVNSEPIKVLGGKSLHIYVNAGDTAYPGVPYYVDFYVKNESDNPVYNVSWDGEEAQPGQSQTYITITPNDKNTPVLSPDDGIKIPVLLPGEYVMVREKRYFGGGSNVYYVLREAMSKKLKGNTEIPITFNIVPTYDPTYIDVDGPEEPEEEYTKLSGKFIYASADNPEKDSEATYYYDDRYFTEDSYKYNQNLATMTLCFAMSAFGSNEEKDYKLKSKNAEKLLKDLGFEKFEKNQGFNEKPSTDSIGAVAASKKIKDDGKEYTLIAVGIRGLGYGDEWASNLTLGSSEQHQGFAEAKKQVLTFLREYIKENEICGDIKLWITGFSRAAATANMVAGALEQGETLGSLVLLKPSNIYAYCFEPPAGIIADKNRDPIYKNIFNIINSYDIVPRVAPVALGFGRYGTDCYLPVKNKSLKLSMLYKYNAFENVPGYNINLFKMKKLNIDNIVNVINDEFDKVVNDIEKKIEDMEKNIKDDEYNGFDDVWDDINDIYDGIMDNISDEEIERICNELIIDDMENPMDQAAFLDEFVKVIGDELIKDRNNYAKNYEVVIRNIVYTKLGRWKLLGRFIVKIVKNRKDLNGATLLVRKHLIVSYLKESLEETIRKSSGLQVDGKILDDIEDFLLNNYDSVITLLLNTDKIGLAHYPELCLAWMQTMDNNYTKGVEVTFSNGYYRIVRVNCPVDAKVYDSDGKLVAAIIDNKPQEISDSSIISAVNEDGEKVFYLPADEDYNLEITATGDGEVTYSVNEFSSQVGDFTRIINYYNIDVKQGDVLKGSIPKYSESDVENTENTSVVYTLTGKNNQLIQPHEDLKGTDASKAYYMINVSADNYDYGMVVGQGMRQIGGYAKVTAIPNEGYKFEGWYEGDECVSTDMEYRFCVKKDKTLIAKFSELTTPTDIYPVQDSFVRKGEFANNNYNSMNELQIKDNAKDYYVRKTYVKFDISTILKAGSVKLKLYLDRTVPAVSNFDLSLSVSEDNWEQTSLVWNNAPKTVSNVFRGRVQAEVGKYIEIDVTNSIREYLKDGKKEISFVLEGVSRQDIFVAFGSSESVNKPILSILPEETPAANFGSQVVITPSADVKIAKDKGNGGRDRSLETFDTLSPERRSLIKFDMNELPKGKKIVSAVLKLHCHGGNFKGHPFEVHSVTKPWKEGTGDHGYSGKDGATWTTSDGINKWDNLGGDYSDTVYAVSEPIISAGLKEIDITKLVKEWYEGTMDNNGLILLQDSSAKHSYVYYDSRESYTKENVPQLVIQFE